jgi:hypothetical protein
VTEKLLKGHKVGNMTYKVHLDGYNLLPYLTGKTKESPRESFLYCNDDQQLTGLRYDNWKLVFMEQRVRGTLQIWAEPFVSLRLPKIYNLRLDPYERADVTSNTYYDWLLDRAFLLVPAQDYVGKFLMTFKDYPPRQKAASDTRRIDMVFGIGYQDDIEQAKSILERLLQEHNLVLDNPAPVVQLHELADSSVNFVCRPWTETDDYWTVYWDITRAVKEAFDEAQISIPYPQRDLHVFQEAAPADVPVSARETSGVS